MKLKKPNIIQIIVTIMIIINCIIYYLYINEFIDFKFLSIGDLNPYGGWSALKSSFMDPSYRWRGVSKAISLTVAILVTALLMGRFFCGFICPIGALQDFLKYLGLKLGIKERKLPRGKVLKPEIIKYFILAITLILSIIGLGNMISPYSPWLAYLNIFLGLNISIGFVILIVIVFLSLIIRRVFCRCFCPLGAFQSLLYAIGPMKINKGENCNGCIYCLKNCPVDMEGTDETQISPECINCLECIETSCIKDVGGYYLSFAGRTMEKKQYIIISLILLIGLYAFLPLINLNTNSQSISQIDNLQEGAFIGMGIGFGGPMQVEIKVMDNRIDKIKIIDHNETLGYYEEVFRNISREIIEKQSLNVDTISGATVTSRGFLNAVKSGISKSLDKP